jgi:creatinine amidohydrolase
MAHTRRTVELQRLSWTELAEAIAEQPIVLLPIGTIEQHGPHMPIGNDNMVAEFVAHRIAEHTNALVAPTINYGCSAVFQNFVGTIAIQPETLAAMIRDVCRALVKQGLRRIVFVDNHGGNEFVCEQVARELKAEFGIVIGNVYPWNLGYQLMRDTYDNPNVAYGHGAEPETSAMLAMFPQDVLLDRKENGGYRDFNGWQARGYSKVAIPGQPVDGTVYLDADEVAPNGVTGNSDMANAERGKIWIERVVGFGVAFVEHFDEVTSATEPTQGANAYAAAAR